MQQVQEKRIRQICIKLHKKWIEKEGYLQKQTNEWKLIIQAALELNGLMAVGMDDLKKAVINNNNLYLYSTIPK